MPTHAHAVAYEVGNSPHYGAKVKKFDQLKTEKH